MSIINRPPEMAKREYELQEPIAVAVEKYATYHPEYPGSRRRFRTEDRDQRDVEFRLWHGPSEKGRAFSRGWRGTSVRKQMPSETPC